MICLHHASLLDLYFNQLNGNRADNELVRGLSEEATQVGGGFELRTFQSEAESLHHRGILVTLINKHHSSTSPSLTVIPAAQR